MRVAKRNPFLTPAMHRVLTWMADDEGESAEYFGYLTQDGGQVWYGLERTNVKLLNALLRLCLISEREASGGDPPVYQYAINSDGRRALTDPEYVPLIVGKV